MAQPEKPLGEIIREASETIWPWLKGRQIVGYKLKSKKLRGRTKLTIDVEVLPKS